MNDLDAEYPEKLEDMKRRFLLEGAENRVLPEDVDGVISALGGYAGGASLYALDGVLYHEYSALVLKRYTFDVGELPAGEVSIFDRAPFAFEGSLKRLRFEDLPQAVATLG